MIFRNGFFPLLLLCTSLTIAQEPTELTLDQCIALAFRQSFPMQTATQQFIASKKSYEAQALSVASSLDLTVNAPEYNESLSSQFDPVSQTYQFYYLQTNYTQSNLTLSQPVAPTGGTLTLTGEFYKLNQTTVQTGSSINEEDYFSNFLVQIRQPLFYPNTLKITRDQANLQLQESYSTFGRNQLDALYQIISAFYNAYQLSQQEQISGDQVKQNQESYETAQNKYGAGLIPEVDLLQSEVDLATSQNQKLSDHHDCSSAKNTLKVLLGLPLDKEITLIADTNYSPIAVDESTAVSKALQNRAELLNAQRDRDLADMNIDLVSSQRHVRFDLTASYGLNRNDTQFDEVFHNFDRSRAISLQMTLPIFDWSRHAREVESAEAQFKNAELNYANTEQQIRQEIIDLISRISEVQSRIQLLHKSVEVAQKGYDISLERFRAGTETRNDLAQAQQRLTTSRLNNLVALIDYRLSIADLTRKTFWDFEKNQPVEIKYPEE
jgi:outer membrane protein TolC